jgi:2-polyprenyl-3-methyl-5-hydroxy-6-metoxy-1,4-benzoquinol methylase
VTTSGARYDDHAEWYAAWVGDGPGMVLTYAAPHLPAFAGLRVLDLACGPGHVSREAARQGASVVGVDISATLLAQAREKPIDGPGDVTYVHADVTQAPTWWDGRPFDICICDLALMDIDDLDGALATVRTVLRPGGVFAASLVHPCMPATARGLSSWPPGAGYDTEGYWTSGNHNPDGARIRVGGCHRKLSTYLNALIAADLSLRHFLEPAAAVPTFLVFVCDRG